MATAEKTLAATGTVEGRAASGRKGKGMTVPRVFSTEGVSPYDQVEWDLRTAAIKDERGQVIFEQVDCEIPRAWSQLATNVVVSKYFYGEINTPERETSVRQLVDRVTRTISDWGREDGYFASAEDADALLRRADGALPEPVRLVQLARLVQRRPLPPLRDRGRGQQLAMGRGDPRRSSGPRTPTSTRRGRPASSSRSTTTWSSIMRLAHSEAMLFKYGSGTGSDLSTPAIQQGEALRRRPAQRPGQLHAGLRRGRQRREVGRQDPPRRQDADAQDLAPRHPRIHRVQDQGGEEGPDPDPRRVRGQLQRRGVQLGPVPERQPLGPRHRRLPPRRRVRRRVDHPRRHHRPPDADLPGRRPDGQDRRGDLALRRPRHAVRGHHPALAHLPQHRADQLVEPLLASTCSSTTRRATSRRST